MTDVTTSDRPQTTASFDGSVAAVSHEDALRANIYGLLARMLTEPPSDETLNIIRALGDADDGTEIGKVLANLGAMAVRTPLGKAEEEYTKLFFGVGAGGEIHPYASYYLTGAIYEKPLADLRDDLGEIGIAPSGHNNEPEDHIAFLCEVMHGLITGAFGTADGSSRQHSFFQRHLAPWAGLMFTDLEAAESAALYMPLGALGRLFFAIEAEAFEMAA
jgi:TorA maturation chaperone TorD